MTVYVVALINIHDRKAYEENYSAGFMDIFVKYQGTMLAVEESPTALEGAWPYTRTVLIEFPDRAALDAWYQSDAYQNLMQHRTAASVASIAVLNALPKA